MTDFIDERDALRTERDEARAEVARLRTQVEQVRKRCQDRLDYGEGQSDLAQDILDALEGK